MRLVYFSCIFCPTVILSWVGSTHNVWNQRRHSQKHSYLKATDLLRFKSVNQSTWFAAPSNILKRFSYSSCRLKEPKNKHSLFTGIRGRMEAREYNNKNNNNMGNIHRRGRWRWMWGISRKKWWWYTGIAFEFANVNRWINRFVDRYLYIAGWIDGSQDERTANTLLSFLIPPRLVLATKR